MDESYVNKDKKDRLLRAAIYLRSSTGLPAEVINLTCQKEECINWCLKRGIPYEVFEDKDVLSIETARRTQYLKMMNEINEGHYNFVVVTKIDRINTDARGLAGFMQTVLRSNCQLITVRLKIGKAITDMAEIFSALEPEQIREQAIAVLKRGIWPGKSVPFGFNNQKTTADNVEFPEIHKENGPIVDFVYKTYMQKQSSDKVVTLLNKKHPRADGWPWDTARVCKILRNPAYKGTLSWNLRYGGSNISLKTNVVLVDNVLPAIVSPEDWQKVQDILDQNRVKDKKNESTGGRKKHIHLLSGLLKCYHCGQPIVGYPSKPDINGKTKTCYVCKGYKNHVCIKNHGLLGIGYAIEGMVSNILSSLNKEMEEKKEYILLEPDQVFGEVLRETSERLKLFEEKLAMPELKQPENYWRRETKKWWTDRYGGDNGYFKYREYIGECEKRDALKVEYINLIGKYIREKGITPLILVNFITNFDTIWKGCPGYELRSLLRALIKRIVIKDRKTIVEISFHEPFDIFDKMNY